MCTLWLIHVDVWQRPTQYCKAIALQFKNEREREKTICLAMQGTWVRSLVGELRSHMPQATKPTSHNY